MLAARSVSPLARGSHIPPVVPALRRIVAVLHKWVKQSLAVRRRVILRILSWMSNLHYQTASSLGGRGKLGKLPLSRIFL